MTHVFFTLFDLRVVLFVITMVAPCPPFHGVVETAFLLSSWRVSNCGSSQSKAVVVEYPCFACWHRIKEQFKDTLVLNFNLLGYLKSNEVWSCVKVCDVVAGPRCASFIDSFVTFCEGNTYLNRDLLVLARRDWTCSPWAEKRSECWQRGGCTPVGTFDTSSGLLEVEWFPHHLNWFFSEWVTKLHSEIANHWGALRWLGSPSVHSVDSSAFHV